MEACWAHNPEVRGSKQRSAKNVFLLETFKFPVDSTFTHNHVGGFRTPKKSIRNYNMDIHSIICYECRYHNISNIIAPAASSIGAVVHT